MTGAFNFPIFDDGAFYCGVVVPPERSFSLRAKQEFVLPAKGGQFQSRAQRKDF
jgi:hypothetical protein